MSWNSQDADRPEITIYEAGGDVAMQLEVGKTYLATGRLDGGGRAFGSTRLRFVLMDDASFVDPAAVGYQGLLSEDVDTTPDALSVEVYFEVPPSALAAGVVRAGFVVRDEDDDIAVAAVDVTGWGSEALAVV
ncbi:MAG: hypothetical protein H6736_13930 [Alphaproteobacteria bacterium]|nr:hypothetical protein [Alphaproteobacteria bacterium]